MRVVQIVLALLALGSTAQAQLPPPGVHAADLQKVLASDGAAGDQFGSAVAMQGVTAVVGAPLHDHAGLADSGAAYVYRFDGTTWNEEAELVAADATTLDQFGIAVDVDNDTIVVGAWKDSNQHGPRAGSAYVFVRGGTSWFQAQKLVASDAASSDEFGTSVALDGTTAVVGAPHHDQPVLPDSGAAYVFQHDGTGLVETAQLLTQANGDRSGSAVAVSGDTIVVGSPGADLAAIDCGRAHVWARSGTIWILSGVLDGSALTANAQLGGSVALGGGLVLAGAELEDLPAAAGAGAVYVFRPQGTGWPALGGLSAGDAAGDDGYGSSVGLSGERAVIGVRLDDDAGADAGSASFLRVVPVPSHYWQTAKLVADDEAAGDASGASIALGGDTAVVGAYLDDGAGQDSGSATVWVRSSSGWSREARLVASDAAADDEFGYSVGIQGDTAVVGAPGDDDAGPLSGSAYVFVRSGTNWSQQAKLVASDAATLDSFGWSVAVQGDTALVGSFCGSAYVFVRSGTDWSQQAKLVASDAVVGDRFGWWVAVDSETAVVGAPYDSNVTVDTGSAYVFVRSGTTWSQQAKLVASDAEEIDSMSAGTRS
jgi:FG-GAP repeat